MERATRPDDHWSGHISFPGGRAEESDPDLLATAIRETREEVGLDLGRARLLGALEPVRAVAEGLALRMTISPFVFHLAEPQDLVLGDEARAAFWFPLADAARGALDAYYPYRSETMSLSLPCWSWEGRVVWGLTYQMLTGLLARLRQG